MYGLFTAEVVVSWLWQSLIGQLSLMQNPLIKTFLLRLLLLIVV